MHLLPGSAMSYCGDILVGTEINCDLPEGHDGEHNKLVFGRSDYYWLTGETFEQSEQRHRAEVAALEGTGPS